MSYNLSWHGCKSPAMYSTSHISEVQRLSLWGRRQEAGRSSPHYSEKGCKSGTVEQEARQKTMTNTYTVKIKHQNHNHTFTVSEDQTILEAAEAQGIHLPSSCNAGVCTTCAGQISKGKVDQSGGNGSITAIAKRRICLVMRSLSPLRLGNRNRERRPSLRKTVWTTHQLNGMEVENRSYNYIGCQQ